ncbi:MAG: 3-oxoacyl-[acyl-carrier-protein] reductase [Candidatus Goldiibacteriota bacterium]
MGLLDGKTAVVTGGAQGIGRSISMKLAESGADIAVVDIDMEKAQAAARDIAEKGVAAQAYKCDVSNMEETRVITEEIHKKFNKIDILVNNAGITRDNLIMRMTEAEWDSVIAINLKGVFNFTKAAAKYMMKQRSGNIVNISSVVGLFGNAGQINYSATKAGVIGMTKSTAKELASRNVRVNAVAPGFIKTAMTDKLGEDAQKKLAEMIPAKALGEPEDVANTVLYLASEMSNYVTGEIIRVDGGMAM